MDCCVTLCERCAPHDRARPHLVSVAALLASVAGPSVAAFEAEYRTASARGATRLLAAARGLAAHGSSLEDVGSASASGAARRVRGGLSRVFLRRVARRLSRRAVEERGLKTCPEGGEDPTEQS